MATMECVGSSSLATRADRHTCDPYTEGRALFPDLASLADTDSPDVWLDRLVDLPLAASTAAKDAKRTAAIQVMRIMTALVDRGANPHASYDGVSLLARCCSRGCAWEPHVTALLHAGVKVAPQDLHAALRACLIRTGYVMAESMSCITIAAVPWETSDGRSTWTSVTKKLVRSPHGRSLVVGLAASIQAQQQISQHARSWAAELRYLLPAERMSA